MLHFEDRGVGRPLLLIPGALGSGQTDFGPQLEEFSKRFRVIAPDPCGYGRSRPPRRDFSGNFLERDALDMAGLMRSLGHQAYLVAGWSDGANAAALLALAEPDRVQRLVVWGGNSFVSAEEIEIYRAMEPISTWSERIRQVLEAVYGDELQGLWSAWCSRMEDIFRSGGELYRNRLPQIRCPTLILHGEKDPLVPAFHPRVLVEEIPGARLEVFSEGKHNLHLRHASEFNRRVLAFLEAETTDEHR